MKKLLMLCVFAAAISSCVITPPKPTIKQSVWLEQGWKPEESRWFHHESQGTATFPLPYEWFMLLEQPIAKDKWFRGAIGNENKLSDSSYLEKFGFIPSEVAKNNPDGLPIGFAKTADVQYPEAKSSYNAIGLTCAGCHTGQMIYNGTSIRIDGGAALINLTAFGEALATALLETYIDPIRHRQFEEAVIEKMLSDNSELSEEQVREIFKKTYDTIAAGLVQEARNDIKMNKESVSEGFARLDALNRIGNTVFGKYNPANIVPTDAPVNYPHLWSTSWFDWVQYDASIMQPMIRNSGEAMGVGALLDIDPGIHQFYSSVAVNKLHNMEMLLAGSEHPQQAKAFTGLKAPQWPEDIFGTIDQEKARQGKTLYDKHCVRCHRPAVSDEAFWSNKYWKKIKGQGRRYYEVVVQDVGTDSAQWEILANRTVNIEGMNMAGSVCKAENGNWSSMRVTSGSKQPFAFVLGLTIEKINKYYYKTNRIDYRTQQLWNGERPNCLQAPKAYKARPLNGIWATAPFLHNASVANLYEMLIPGANRASTVYLGYQGFDPVKVGYISTKQDGLPHTEGLTKVIVSGAEARKGNLNTGHEFSANKGIGVIGPLFNEKERWALVEYLKTL